MVSVTQTSVKVGTSIPYARVHNDGLIVSRGPHTDKFIRPRYKIGARGKMFGGMGAFRKMTAKEKNAEPVVGQSYKAYSFKMPQRKFLGFTPELNKKLVQIVKEEYEKEFKV